MAGKKFQHGLHLLLSDRVHKALTQLSYQSGYPITWLVRHAVQKYLQTKGVLD